MIEYRTSIYVIVCIYSILHITFLHYNNAQNTREFDKEIAYIQIYSKLNLLYRLIIIHLRIT